MLPKGLAFAATLPREDARDALISLTEKSLKGIKQGAVLGSSSVRRSAQALRIRPDLQVVQFRGNVETRLRKLADGVADASFLAVAGLRRLGLTQHIAAVIPMEEMLPAIAQGAIGIEIREGDEKTMKLLAPINHQESATAMACERAFLAALDGLVPYPDCWPRQVGRWPPAFPWRDPHARWQEGLHGRAQRFTIGRGRNGCRRCRRSESQWRQPHRCRHLGPCASSSRGLKKMQGRLRKSFAPSATRQ